MGFGHDAALELKVKKIRCLQGNQNSGGLQIELRSGVLTSISSRQRSGYGNPVIEGYSLSVGIYIVSCRGIVSHHGVQLE